MIGRNTFVNLTIAATIGSVFAIASSSATAGGTERHWIESAGGAFQSSDNWDGPVPNANVTAIFDLASTYTVTFDSSAFSDRVLVGNGNVTYDLGGFNYSLINPVATTPSIVVGDLAKGVAQLTITNGTLFAKFTNIGEVAGSSGLLFVADGSNLLNDFHLRVGYNGDGAFELSSGSTAVSFVTQIGIEDSATGSAIVTGLDTELFADSAIIVALQGTGNLSILDGATVTSGTAVIGEQLFSNGSVTVSGPGSSWTIDGPFDVGQTGQGTLEILDGGHVVTNSFVTVGTFLEPVQFPIFGGVGEIIVDGTDSLLEVQGDLFIGFLAYGRWTLSSGGKVSVVGDVFRGDWLEGDKQPQTIIEISSSSDYITPAITSTGLMSGFSPRIDLIDGFMPSEGDSFEIASATMVDTFTFDLPALPDPLGWEVQQDATSISLSVIVACPWDLDNSGSVGASDMLVLFSQWGTSGTADFDGSGEVNTADLLILFANWGPCP